ncbi:phage holin family protein [uncultured Cyclobacterium sp.]|uniref:phage holin family protein n=1 Tax=uncultured Cyclobacterium sp. TaxID=453820 RepID=UPI0030EF6843|tara:strand:- start:71064 stop:71408 length:345 start_codon:yes stop_codon:yes gene_type:complete
MNQIITTIKKLIEVRVDIIKAEIVDQISSVVARVAVIVLIVLSASFILLFGSIALAFYFSELYGSTSIGFLLLTGIYLIIFLFLVFLRNAMSFQSVLKNSLYKFVFLFKDRKDG